MSGEARPRLAREQTGLDVELVRELPQIISVRVANQRVLAAYRSG